MPFAKLGLSEPIVNGVERAGYQEPTPIQQRAIPPILEGRDIIATAQTGTGKTAAFVLPVLERIARTLKDKDANAKPKGPRCLVLAPTRELALQVEESVRTYGRFLRVRSAVLYGGVAIGPQVQALHAQPDVVIATPGRLLDHLGRGNVRFSRLEVLVLDEADRMLDMGFLPDIRRILSELPARRQNLLFSATMARGVEALARSFMRDPVRISIGVQATPAEGVSQSLYPVAGHLKTELLARLLEITPHKSVLIFTRTKRGAERVARALAKKGFPAVALHGDKTQSQRERALQGFREQKHRILVATDVAARGLDIRDISHVINYDVPESFDAYVHRVGRTARANARGEALTLVAMDEEDLVRDIERRLKRSLPRVGVPDFEYSAPAPPRYGSRSRGSREGQGRSWGRGRSRRRSRGSRSGARQ